MREHRIPEIDTKISAVVLRHGGPVGVPGPPEKRNERVIIPGSGIMNKEEKFKMYDELYYENCDLIDSFSDWGLHKKERYKREYQKYCLSHDIIIRILEHRKRIVYLEDAVLFFKQSAKNLSEMIGCSMSDYEKALILKAEQLIKESDIPYLKTRFMVFQRDGFKCQYCGRGADATVLEIDHIFPRSKGGTNNIDNLITSCYECNRGKGDLLLIERKELKNGK